MPQPAPFSIQRIFKAPITLVWPVLTEPKHVGNWLSPEGFKTIHADMDFRVGGAYHYGLEGPGGLQMWGKQVFREIAAPEKIVYLQSFSDKDGGLARHPMAATWPLEILAMTTCEEVGGETKVTITWEPFNSDEAGNATFDAARAGMAMGFNGTLAKLEAYLAGLVQSGL